MKKQLCAVALLTTTALTATAQADDFTYLSGGLLYNQQGSLANLNEQAETELPGGGKLTSIEKEENKQKTSGVGYYLNGSVGFENQVFVEGRIHHSRLLHQALLGVGYHYPIMQQVDVYGLVGLSQRSIATRENQAVPINDSSNKLTGYDHQQEFTANYSDKLKPTIELGCKANFNEVAGVRVAYRFAQFGDKNKLNGAPDEKSGKSTKISTNLHEGHIGGYYKISDNLAAEAGYTYTTSLKGSLIKDKTSKDHAGTVGLRYTF